MFASPLAPVALLSAGALLAAACPAPAATGDGADLATGGTADLAGCDDGVGDRARGGVCIRDVGGRLVDEAGAAVVGATVTVCAAACFYGATDARGDFTVPVGKYLVAREYALLTHVNPRRAAFYLALPPPEGEHVRFAAPIRVPAMPADGPVIRDDGSPQRLSQGAVTVDIAGGTNLFFSVEDTLEAELGTRLRPLRVARIEDLPFAPELLAAGPRPLALFGFGPFEIDFRPPARLELANDLGLAPGTAVELLAQRGLLRGGPPGARFDVVATARVSPDGTRIEMDPGTGLDTLTWIAFRRKDPQ